jgi:hypothetical protein
MALWSGGRSLGTSGPSIRDPLRSQWRDPLGD